MVILSSFFPWRAAFVSALCQYPGQLTGKLLKLLSVGQINVQLIREYFERLPIPVCLLTQSGAI